MLDPILLFDQIERHHLRLVGGKALNLGRLFRAGFPVPEGFVITTAADPGRDDFPDAVAAAYQRLGGGAVAVRSSATAEDLQEASFAGQQETVLGVTSLRALMAAIDRCRASLFTQHATAYRQALGPGESAPAIAVVVQKMVPADTAGVLFTQDPAAALARMLVEASWGLGESVVSGRVTPDRWSLDRDTGEIIDHQPGQKATRVDIAGESEVPAPDQARSCLTEGQLCALADLGRAVEAEYGAPQDIEWAFAGSQLFLLQSRPITTSLQRREQVRLEEIVFVQERAEAGGTVWSRYSLAEVLPEPLPLTWQFWRQFMSGGGGYGRMYRELGYDPDPCLDADGIVDLIAGRVYFNLSRDAKIYFHRFPYDYPFDKIKANPDLAIYPSPEANLSKARRGFALQALGITRQMLAAEKTLERAAESLPERLAASIYPAMQQRVSEARKGDLAGLSDREIVALIEDWRHYLFDEFLPIALQPGLLAGLTIQKLEKVLQGNSAAGAAKPAIASLLADAAPPLEHDLAGGLRSLAGGQITLQQFLAQFGHRGHGELELANPRWREVPEALRLVAASDPASPDLSPRATDSPSMDQVLSGRSAVKASEALERARRFTALRESSKHWLMLGYEVLRAVLLELDRRLDLQNGVFYLEPHELQELSGARELRAMISTRRKRRSLALGLEAPRVLFSDDVEAIGRSVVADEAAVLPGNGVSAGSAEGLALVLRSPGEAPPGVRDFILICPFTDPGWTPLFLQARGLVLETGGMLSHGAIVARELGLPAVANVAGACSRIRTGQRVRVDGVSGRVTVL